MARCHDNRRRRQARRRKNDRIIAEHRRARFDAFDATPFGAALHRAARTVSAWGAAVVAGFARLLDLVPTLPARLHDD